MTHQATREELADLLTEYATNAMSQATHNADFDGMKATAKAVNAVKDFRAGRTLRPILKAVCREMAEEWEIEQDLTVPARFLGEGS